MLNSFIQHAIATLCYLDPKLVVLLLREFVEAFEQRLRQARALRPG